MFEPAHLGVERADPLLERGDGGVLVLDDRQEQLDGRGTLGQRDDRDAQSGGLGHRLTARSTSVYETSSSADRARPI